MPAHLTLDAEVKYLKGVGPTRAAMLAGRSIHTVEDLLYYTPFRYEDRTRLTAVRDLVPGQVTTVLVEVLTAGLTRTRRGAYIFDLAARDASGMLRCKWFNAVYLDRHKVFRPGQRVFFHGKVEHDPYGARVQMLQPQFEVLMEEPVAGGESLEVSRVVPIYESISRLTPRVLRRLIWTGLGVLDGEIPESLPESVRSRNRLADRGAALRGTHFPEKDTPLDELVQFRTPAQVRLIFEEFFNVSAGLLLRRRKAKAREGIAFHTTRAAHEAVKRILPFRPTSAQKRALAEIVNDMRAPRPMNRLLQGDVGSGKTIVALQAAIVAIDNGYQVAVMAPTEILATQHYFYMKQLLEPLPYQVDLLSSGRRGKEKAEVKRRLAAGEIHLIVGTHALIEQDVEFARLGLVVVDEQHRFGVIQRHTLIRKGLPPDVLTMTATPIPRTLALTLYGDLESSVIDELPPGRAPIETRLVHDRDRASAHELIRERVLAGEQAYVVYPVIEESEKSDVQAAVHSHQQLAANVFPEFKVGLLHGRLPGAEKERAMLAFKSGETRILVSTTVIEVGVDVPSASVMLIEHADRFGLAQLHQLRGRIGRGRAKSYCMLLAGEPRTEAADERLRALVETCDGFRIAEMDLKIRGPGEFFGTRQWGIPAFRVANLLRDQKILEWARSEAERFIAQPSSPDELAQYVAYLRRIWPRRYGLASVA
ncbi:MAG TPA: ATP-dependent DNA helicase RecG [Terriglobia bacterium]|nr:ATP-dependent DNA helicase RecG [Terriglobia bacterium]